MVETYADVLFAKGEKEGELKGMRRTILRQATKHLGHLDPNAESALNAIADLSRLERMSDRVHEVSSWAELLATT